jgi:hypothetical protein
MAQVLTSLSSFSSFVDGCERAVAYAVVREKRAWATEGEPTNSTHS